LAIRKVQSVILSVFTLVTSLMDLFRLKSGDTRGQDNEGNHVGLERPPWSFGHKHLAKTGVAPAQHGVLPASKVIVLSHVNSSSRCPCSIVKVNARVTDRVNCAFHAPVTFLCPKKRLRFVAIDTHLLLKRPRKRKNARESFGLSYKNL